MRQGSQGLVVHCKKSAYDVYIGRPNRAIKGSQESPWGNPFKIGRDGSRADVIAKYRTWLEAQPDLMARARLELRGKVLGCWCAPQACHGDVLAAVANAFGTSGESEDALVCHPASAVVKRHECAGTSAHAEPAKARAVASAPASPCEPPAAQRRRKRKPKLAVHSAFGTHHQRQESQRQPQHHNQPQPRPRPQPQAQAQTQTQAQRIVLPRPPTKTVPGKNLSKRRQQRNTKLAVHEHGSGDAGKQIPAGTVQARATSSRHQNDRGRPPAEVSLSKAMSWVLRHGAVKLQLPLRPDGFVSVSSLLRVLERGNGCGGRRVPKQCLSVSLVRKVVAECPKQRFTLVEEASTMDGGGGGGDADGGGGGGGTVLMIRANQGHTMKHVKDSELLRRVHDASEVPVCVHGTYLAAWQGATGIAQIGLSRMRRNHVHFAVGLPGASGVISGMRGDVEILVYVDVALAMAAGLEFYISANGVVLCAGDSDGLIAPRFFAKVTRKSDGTELK